MDILKSDYELYHHGIKGQKWGVRRYQNYDGSHTPEGRERERYRKRQERDTKRGKIDHNKKELKNAACKYVDDAKKARKALAEFDEQNPEVGKDWYLKDSPVRKYERASLHEREQMRKKNPELVDKIEKRNKLDDEFNKLSGSNNSNWDDFYKKSEKFINEYGHESFRNTLGDDANLYYTELWRMGLDDKIDYDSGQIYYRNLSEELW